MLARLDRIDGVSRSFGNHAGTMIRITVAPSADRDKVVEGVERVLGEEAKEPPIRVRESDLGQLLSAEEWRDSSQIRELSAIELRTLVVRLLAVLLVLGILGFWFIHWRRKRKLLIS